MIDRVSPPVAGLLLFVELHPFGRFG